MTVREKPETRDVSSNSSLSATTERDSQSCSTSTFTIDSSHSFHHAVRPLQTRISWLMMPTSRTVIHTRFLGDIGRSLIDIHYPSRPDPSTRTGRLGTFGTYKATGTRHVNNASRVADRVRYVSPSYRTTLRKRKLRRLKLLGMLCLSRQLMPTLFPYR